MKLRTLAILTLFLAPLGTAELNDDVNNRFSFEQDVDNVQPGCITLDREINPCHQIATSMNGLDTPKIDILILVPASAYAERDMRVLRQSTEMWADGIEWMSRDMGLDWLADGVEFHISGEIITSGEAEFTTYPIVDPEIVVIASNPVGGIGIGIDPVDFAGDIFGSGLGQGPCHGVANPFDNAAWENLPGYNSHHDGRSGTYVEECDGAGGNICFSVNGAIEPDPTDTLPDPVDFGLYDLASHELGHCLTIGHVGDGAEGSWSSVPTNDIMAYHSDPPGLVKCISSLDVEAFAVEMSRWLDTNGDGTVNETDRYWANDAEGSFDARPFQIQHPDNHLYASPDRTAMTCPQPDLDVVPVINERADFFPVTENRTQIGFTNVMNNQEVPRGDVVLGGLLVGNGSGDVTVSWTTLASFNADPMGNVASLNNTNQTDVMATVTGDVWTAKVPFAAYSSGTELLVTVTWGNEEMIDSDRVVLRVNQTAAAPAAPITVDGQPVIDESEDTPALPIFAVLGVLAIALLRRR